jgi:pyridoxamine 5'-phosphate oxidase
MSTSSGEGSRPGWGSTMTGKDPAVVRARLRRTGIDRADLSDDALEQFKRWHQEWLAVGPVDPSAMVLATAGPDGPTARLMRLSWVDWGFVFFTDRESRKAGELDNGRAALCFVWLELGRQLRIGGTVERLDDQRGDAHFAQQPREAQLLAWASDQRSLAADRDQIRRAYKEITDRFPGSPPPRPERWGGYRLVPFELELWQGRTDALADRFCYRRPSAAAPWRIDRLFP